jgi:hypothetical protein
MTDLVRVKRGRRPWVTEPESGGGGGSEQTQTVTFTTDPDTFEGVADFDLGDDFVLVNIVGVVTAGDADGETWGSNSGDIQASGGSGGNLTDDDPTFSHGATFFASQLLTDTYGDNLSLPVTVSNELGSSYRYIRFQAFIRQNGGLYAGSNHPTADYEVTVTYRS